jgi:hypothetical protein
VPLAAAIFNGIRRWSLLTEWVASLYRTIEKLVTGLSVVTLMVDPGAALAGEPVIAGRLRAVPSAFSK